MRLTADRLFKYLSVALAIALVMAWLTSCKSTAYSKRVKGRAAAFR